MLQIPIRIAMVIYYFCGMNNSVFVFCKCSTQKDEKIIVVINSHTLSLPLSLALFLTLSLVADVTQNTLYFHPRHFHRPGPSSVSPSEKLYKREGGEKKNWDIFLQNPITYTLNVLQALRLFDTARELVHGKSRV